MSEIPFVTALGDEIERSAAERIASRRRRIRRRITLGALGFAVAATGVAAASGVFSSPEQLANNGVACFDAPALNRNVTVVPTGELSPIETCRRVLKTDRPLVACADEAVHVFPGGPGTCEKLGMRPLPAEYDAARRRVHAFARAIAALEKRVGCMPTDEFAARVQDILDRSGWKGWSVWVRHDLDEGPCGSVTGLGGDGQRSIEGALAGDERRVMVTGRLSHATEDLLYSSDGIVGPLLDASGARCFDVAGLKDLARQHLGAADLPLTFSVKPPPDADVEIEGGQGERLAEGCPIIVGVSTNGDGRELVVEIWDD
jgi:hypothetical protein